MLALEEATLSTDLQQGYALKSLTGREPPGLPFRAPWVGVWGLTLSPLGAGMLFPFMLAWNTFKLCIFLIDVFPFLSSCLLLTSLLP